MSASLPLLIKQGDPAVIATLMNHALQVYGVRVQVQRRENTLHILLEAEELPTPQTVIPFVCESWRLLELEPIQAVMIYSRVIGDRLPAWQKRIQRQPPHAPQPLYLASPDGAETSADARAMDQTTTLAAVQSVSAIVASAGSELMSLDTDPVDDSIITLAFPTHPPALTPIDLMGPALEDPDLLKRPEAVIFVMFCSLVLIWDTYLSVVEEPIASTHLSSGQLARRLQTSRRTIRRMKRLDRFSEWTQSLDPEGKAWIYRRGLYMIKE